MPPMQQLLQEVCGARHQDDWRADREGHHFITLDHDVVLTLSASVDGDDWLLTASPGRLNADRAANAGSPLNLAELEDPNLSGAIDRVLVDHARLIVLQRVIPRARLDAVELRRELHRCLQMVRWWQETACA